MKKQFSVINTQEKRLCPVDKRSAYHQAGYVAAIYLGNKQKQLPAVHFQIQINGQAIDKGEKPSKIRGVKGKRIVNVEGGRLIQSLPLSKVGSSRELTDTERQELRIAFEADIVNILVGPLAEAKYVALRDDEVFNPNLVYLGALKFYGGRKELGTVYEYLDCIISQTEERDRKLAELFLAAYGFINNRSNWQAISALAIHILEYPKDILDCNDVIALLESSRLAA
jgi:hypothetical protein